MQFIVQGSVAGSDTPVAVTVDAVDAIDARHKALRQGIHATSVHSASPRLDDRPGAALPAHAVAPLRRACRATAILAASYWALILAELMVFLAIWRRYAWIHTGLVISIVLSIVPAAVYTWCAILLMRQRARALTGAILVVSIHASLTGLGLLGLVTLGSIDLATVGPAASTLLLLAATLVSLIRARRELSNA